MIFIFILFFINISVFANELRIVSLAPNLTEIVYSLGLGKNLVGNTSQCNYPESAKNIYKVGDYINPNIERILFTKPNVVLATEGNPQSILNKLKLQGIKVIETNPKTAEELPISIEKISFELGVNVQGEQISKKIAHEIKLLKNNKKSNKKFLLLLQFDPIYSVSDKTWLGNLFTLGGYVNVIGSSRISYPIVSKEYLIKHKPDIIFAGREEQVSAEDEKRIQLYKLEKIFGKEEVKKIILITLPKDILVRPGPRIIEGMHFIESLSF